MEGGAGHARAIKQNALRSLGGHRAVSAAVADGLLGRQERARLAPGRVSSPSDLDLDELGELRRARPSRSRTTEGKDGEPASATREFSCRLARDLRPPSRRSRACAGRARARTSTQRFVRRRRRKRRRPRSLLRYGRACARARVLPVCTLDVGRRRRSIKTLTLPFKPCQTHARATAADSRIRLSCVQGATRAGHGRAAAAAVPRARARTCASQGSGGPPAWTWTGWGGHTTLVCTTTRSPRAVDEEEAAEAVAEPGSAVAPLRLSWTTWKTAVDGVDARQFTGFPTLRREIVTPDGLLSEEFLEERRPRCIRLQGVRARATRAGAGDSRPAGRRPSEVPEGAPVHRLSDGHPDGSTKHAGRDSWKDDAGKKFPPTTRPRRPRRPRAAGACRSARRPLAPPPPPPQTTRRRPRRPSAGRPRPGAP